MSGWSPPTPSGAPVAIVAVGYLVVWAYFVLIQGSVLIGLLPGLGLAVLYVLWRFLVALEAIADGVHRIADARERES